MIGTVAVRLKLSSARAAILLPACY